MYLQKSEEKTVKEQKDEVFLDRHNFVIPVYPTEQLRARVKGDRMAFLSVEKLHAVKMLLCVPDLFITVSSKQEKPN